MRDTIKDKRKKFKAAQKELLAIGWEKMDTPEYKLALKKLRLHGTLLEKAEKKFKRRIYNSCAGSNISYPACTMD